MGFFQSLPWIGWASGRQLVDALGEKVAQRSSSYAVGLMANLSTEMTPAQRRGYARARLSQTVRRELQNLTRQYPRLSDEQKRQVFENAMQRVVNQAVSRAVLIRGYRSVA